MSREKAPWVKWQPTEFLNGVIGLDAAEIGVYSVILNMIYDKGGPIDDDVPRLARRCGIRVDRFTKILETLVKMEKVLRADGVLSNKKCEIVLVTRTNLLRKLSDNLHGAAPQPEQKANKTNGAHHPIADTKSDENRGQTQNQNKNRGGSRAAPTQPTPKRAMAIPRPARLPEDWTPGDSGMLYARSLNLTQREAEVLAKKFQLHYRAAAGPKSVCNDWGARWQTWCLSQAEQLGRLAQADTKAAKEHSPADYSRQEWSRVIQVWQMTNRWNPDYGPAPGQRGCLCPSDLIVNHG
jgi:uncharacterized protein YdaU (DUF1376 family)